MNTSFLEIFFCFNPLSLIMLILVTCIGVVVAKFAVKYMKGDRKYQQFFIYLASLILSVISLSIANNLISFLIFWGLNNIILVKMMIHKSNWSAAKNSGIITLRTYIIGFFALLIAFTLLYNETQEFFIDNILHYHPNSTLSFLALVLILIAAMTQSAIWPFHTWLISSLNSPLPVSALMHAGLVNGGGFLLVKFARLFLNYPILLNLMFAIGLVTAILGTSWKLMQSDIKRMLACSTMAQMGFMLMQCGLGFFSAAIAHIILHGCFKSYLFLSSASAAQEKRLELHYPPSITTFLVALACGSLGSYCFATLSDKTWISYDTTIVLVTISFIACTQLSIAFLRKNIILNLPLAILASVILGSLYGYNIHLIDSLIVELNLAEPQKLNLLHISGLLIMITLWLSVIFSKYLKQYIPEKFCLWLYVKLLNYSQPDPQTITSHRNYYKY
jgi:NAD(P)H-quinone oxidoreductase subunit 5